ncbi:MAG: carbohydrate ABC transporter permease [Candidatus Humimicrobiaceae bacterium]
MKKKYFLYFFLAIIAILFLVPIYVLLVTSFKGFEEVTIKNMWNLPKTLYLGNYISAFDYLRTNTLNSLYLTIVATAISAMLGSWNGYILSKWKFPGANILFSLILFGMFIPYQSILIPLVNFLRFIGLYGSIPGLILTHVIYGIPITTLIFRNYYAGVPNELLEAGKIDGAGIFEIYRYVLFPISIPAFVVVIVWQFTSIWNEFLFALVVTHNPKIQPVTVALANLAGSYFAEWNVQMAGALFISIPPLLVFIFLGRYFIRGLLAGSVKG